MSNGSTASITVTFAGTSASSHGQEVDLSVDAGGDVLTINPAGDVLMVSTGLTTFVGSTAVITWPTATLLVNDPGQFFVTEAGQQLET